MNLTGITQSAKTALVVGLDAAVELVDGLGATAHNVLRIVVCNLVDEPTGEAPPMPELPVPTVLQMLGRPPAAAAHHEVAEPGPDTEDQPEPSPDLTSLAWTTTLAHELRDYDLVAFNGQEARVVGKPRRVPGDPTRGEPREMLLLHLQLGDGGHHLLPLPPDHGLLAVPEVEIPDSPGPWIAATGEAGGAS